MRSWYIILGLIALTGAAYAVSVTAPLEEDTFVSQSSPEMSFSENDTLWAISESGQPISEVYLGFINNLHDSGVWTQANVETASLKLYASQVKNSGWISAYLVHSPTLSTNNWNDRYDYDKEVNSRINITKEGAYTFDVASLVGRAAATCETNCSYSIVLIPEGNASIGFASMESSDKDKAPTLEYTSA